MKFILKITDLEDEVLGIYTLYAKTESEAQTKADLILGEFGEPEDLNWELRNEG